MRQISVPSWVVAVVIAGVLLLVGVLLWNAATGKSNDVAVPLNLGSEGQLAPQRSGGAASEP